MNKAELLIRLSNKWEDKTQTKVDFENSIDFAFVTFILPKINENGEGDAINYENTKIDRQLSNERR